MAVVSVTASQVSMLFASRDNVRVYHKLSDVDLAAGQLVYLKSNGKLALANGTTAVLVRARGVALSTIKAGQPVAVLARGHLAGYDLSAINPDTVLYVSNTDGAFDTVAGTVSRVVGVVDVTTELDSSGVPVRALFVDCDWT